MVISLFGTLDLIADACLLLADSAREQGELDLEMRALEGAVQRSPSDFSDDFFRLATYHLQRREYAIVQLYLKLLGEHSTRSKRPEILKLLETARQEFVLPHHYSEEERNNFQANLELDELYLGFVNITSEEAGNVSIEAATLAYALGNSQRAMAFLERIPFNSPKYNEARFQMGQYALINYDFQSAENFFTEALKKARNKEQRTSWVQHLEGLATHEHFRSFKGVAADLIGKLGALEMVDSSPQKKSDPDKVDPTEGETVLNQATQPTSPPPGPNPTLNKSRQETASSEWSPAAPKKAPPEKVVVAELPSLPEINPYQPVQKFFPVDVTFQLIVDPMRDTFDNVMSSIYSVLLQTVTPQRGQVCIVFKGDGSSAPYNKNRVTASSVRSELEMILGVMNPSSRYFGRANVLAIDKDCTLEQAMEAVFRLGIGKYRVTMIPGDTFREYSIIEEMVGALKANGVMGVIHGSKSVGDLAAVHLFEKNSFNTKRLQLLMDCGGVQPDQALPDYLRALYTKTVGLKGARYQEKGGLVQKMRAVVSNGTAMYAHENISSESFTKQLNAIRDQESAAQLHANLASLDAILNRSKSGATFEGLKSEAIYFDFYTPNSLLGGIRSYSQEEIDAFERNMQERYEGYRMANGLNEGYQMANGLNRFVGSNFFHTLDDTTCNQFFGCAKNELTFNIVVRVAYGNLKVKPPHPEAQNMSRFILYGENPYDTGFKICFYEYLSPQKYFDEWCRRKLIAFM